MTHPYRSFSVSCALAFAFALPSSAWAAKPSPKSARIDLQDAQGKKVGNAWIEDSGTVLQVRVHVTGLPPGEHGIHFHEVGKCDGPDFKSAGEHFQPSKEQHGLMSSSGPHEGDLPNLFVREDGTADAVLRAPRVTLGSGKASLLTGKGSGTALVIHADRDDQKSNPAGDSGDRIACGVVRENS